MRPDKAANRPAYFFLYNPYSFIDGNAQECYNQSVHNLHGYEF